MNIRDFSRNMSEKTKFSLTTIRIVIISLLLILMFTAIRNAWISDDAYISFRTVFMFTEGHGLTFNIDERVQTFTNPLWVLLLSGFYFFTDEAFVTSLSLSIVCTAICVWLLAAKTGNWKPACIIALISLMLSKAFVDYSTSGLENPLTHMLLAIFGWNYLKEEKEKPKILMISLIGGFLVLNRMDTLLLIAPAILLVFWRNRSWKNLAMVALGFSPFFIWEFFSLIYYGFPFPNTAYAKLNTGIPGSDLAMQGLKYYHNSIRWDPVTLTTIGISLLFAFASRKMKYAALGFGVILYCIYIVKVGGDFMSGRFFAAPLLLSCIILMETCKRRMWWMGIATVVLVTGIAGPRDPLTLPANPNTLRLKKIDKFLVADERLWYRDTGNISNLSAGNPIFEHEEKLDRKRSIDPDTFTLLWFDNIGFIGYGVGPSYHVADKWGLADPLIARLPMAWDPEWRVGHYERQVPEGMIQSLRSGKNLLEDQNLAAYYEKLSLITRGRIWAWERLVTIIKFNLGRYNHLVNMEYYSHPSLAWVNYENMSELTPQGSAWDGPGTIRILKDRPLKINFGAQVWSDSVEVALDGNDKYVLEFIDTERDTLLYQVHIQPAFPASGGIQIYSIGLPAFVRREGFNRIQIEAISGDGWYGAGHLLVTGDK